MKVIRTAQLCSAAPVSETAESPEGRTDELVEPRRRAFCDALEASFESDDRRVALCDGRRLARRPVPRGVELRPHIGQCRIRAVLLMLEVMKGLGSAESCSFTLPISADKALRPSVALSCAKVSSVERSRICMARSRSVS